MLASLCLFGAVVSTYSVATPQLAACVLDYSVGGCRLLESGLMVSPLSLQGKAQSTACVLLCLAVGLPS